MKRLCNYFEGKICFNCKFFIIFLFNFRRRGCSSVHGVYNEFCKDDVLKECFPVAIIIPSFTALVERGFSLMSNIVSKKRNRLTEKNTDALMHICHTNKDLTDNDLETIVTNFKGLKKRKLDM